MKWKDIITDYFTFTRRERIGIIIIIMVILALAFSPSFFSANMSSKLEIPDTAWVTAIKKLEQKESSPQYRNYEDGEDQAYQYDPSKSNYNNKPAGELFYFDPNTLSKEGWQRLGIRDKTIKTIQNYLAKGGHFRKPEDMQRVYGLRKNEYERLAPFVNIQLRPKEGTEKNSAGKNTLAEYSVPSKSYRPLVIDINSADTSALIALPGIGSKLAARIINFREKLGGFHSIEQIRETFGLQDSTFQKIKEYLKLENVIVRKININSATVDELKAHPYIKYSIANPIIAYRNEHGRFTKLEDLKKVMVITDEVYERVARYLTL
jgi:competence protein ComEA